MRRITAVVLAAGRGSRMGGDVPKQFMPVHGKPLLAYSLFAFEKSGVDQIVIVCSDDGRELCESIVREYGILKCDTFVKGGETRADSVYNGVAASTGSLVLIHDSARPLVSQQIISDTIEALQKHEAAVPVVPVKDTIRQLRPDGRLEAALDRNTLYGMQTPQAFRRERLLAAYERLFAEGEDMEKITDDVCVMEKAFGVRAVAVEGSELNRKMTTAADMAWLEAQDESLFEV